MADAVPISVLIPARDEAGNIAACVASAAGCGEIVVIDSDSTDGTPDIARAAGAKVVNFRWNGAFPKKKNWALTNVPWSNDWVFILDADERMTPALIGELGRIVFHAKFAGYYVNRRFWFLDGWLNHCGYYPSWNLRFFRHVAGRYERLAGSIDTNSGDNEIHEHVVLQGEAGYLLGELEHYAFPDVTTWAEKHNRYSSWEARVELGAPRVSAENRHLDPRLARKRRLRQLAWRLPFRPSLRFCYHYFLKAGFLDGYRGYVFCRLMAYYEFLSTTKAAELRRHRSSKPPPHSPKR